MSNPERRVQVRIGDGAVPSTVPLSDADAAVLRGEIALDPTDAFPGSKDDELTHPDWSNPNLLEPNFASTAQPRAVERATDTHDAAEMLRRARKIVADPGNSDRVVAEAYFAEEAAGRAAQVGDRLDLEKDEPDEDPIALSEDPEADQADLPTEEPPISLDAYVRPSVVQGRSPWNPIAGEPVSTFDPGEFVNDDEPIVLPSYDQGGGLSNVTGSFSTPAGFFEDPRSQILSPTDPPSSHAMNSFGDMQPSAGMRPPTAPETPPIVERTSRTAAPSQKEESRNIFGRAAQAITSTARRWGQRLGLLGAVASSTIYAPESQKPITAPHSEEIAPDQVLPISQPAVEAPMPFVTQTTPPEDLPVGPVAESRVQTIVTPAPAVADVTPPRVSVRLPDFGTPQRSPVQARDAASARPQYKNTTADGHTYYSDEPLVPLKVTLGDGDSVAPAAPMSAAVTAEPTPATPPAPVVDVPQPVADSMTAVQQPPPSVEVSKQLNQDISRGPLSPEKQIEYIKNLFDTLDTSKIFIRLSPTKRLELRQYPTGEIEARFPGEKDFQALTAEEIKGLGDLTKKPHYSR